jgi:predicted N-acetyltransferase YhbS
MTDLLLRPMTPDDDDAVAELIVASTNHWYREHFGREVFGCSAAEARLFGEVYRAIDPVPGLVVEDTATGRLAGSCFYHPRPTHVGLGIMNASPGYAGRGVARRLLRHITDHADAAGLPTRLISSAMNLDSFSLYNRAGFRPTAVYQDMLITVPPGGVATAGPPAGTSVRPATPADVAEIEALEDRLSGIRRPGDWRYFIDHASGGWHTLVAEAGGALVGVLASIDHPASAIVGPGVAEDEPTALALLAEQLCARRGRTMLVLAPSGRPAVTAQLYAWGARNCELHVTQVRGEAAPGTGVVFPTFMPETG